MDEGRGIERRSPGRTAFRHHPDRQIRFFTIADVAEQLDVATRTVRRWINSGDLVAHRFGGVVRIAEGDLRAFLAAHRE
jgi:excisionase family DNA binding protein